MADLGLALGLPGGVAYARGFRSMHHFLGTRFGAAAVWLFSLILLFRLWNEIWSNTMATGSRGWAASASSTLDSTFASTGKLVAIDLVAVPREARLRVARVAMVALALLGGLMVHAGPAILSATTVSATMVIGLTPVFVLWWWDRPGRASYLASVLAGLAAGVGLALGWIPGGIGEGRYANLLFVNVVGIAACFALFVALAWLRPGEASGPPAEAEPSTAFASAP